LARPHDGAWHGIAGGGTEGSSWYLPLDPDAVDRPPWLPRWFARDDRTLIGHDLKQLLVLLAQAGIELRGTPFDSLVASYMLNPALRAQTLDDLAANRYGSELPPRPVSGGSGAEESV